MRHTRRRRACTCTCTTCGESLLPMPMRDRPRVASMTPMHGNACHGNGSESRDNCVCHAMRPVMRTPRGHHAPVRCIATCPLYVLHPMQPSCARAPSHALCVLASTPCAPCTLLHAARRCVSLCLPCFSLVAHDAAPSQPAGHVKAGAQARQRRSPCGAAASAGGYLFTLPRYRSVTGRRRCRWGHPFAGRRPWRYWWHGPSVRDTSTTDTRYECRKPCCHCCC